MRRLFFPAAFSFLMATSIESHAETINHAQQYQACMDLVQMAPSDAFESALGWKSLGGGEAAEHCIATSLIKMKRYRHGADRLEKLADSSRKPKEFKAELLAQAAQGWLLAGENDRARAVLTTAIKLDELNPELYIDRAFIRSQQNHFKDALLDLDTALALNMSLVDGYLYRGSIKRQMEQFEEALKDINHALDLVPDHPEALLERGMLYRIEQKNDLARADWLLAIEQAPTSKTAEIARLNLQKMDRSKE